MRHWRRLSAWVLSRACDHFDKLQGIAGKSTKIAGNNLQGRENIIIFYKSLIKFEFLIWHGVCLIDVNDGQWAQTDLSN
jgi:hypothetical protein